jgi:hypothetical protein
VSALDPFLSLRRATLIVDAGPDDTRPVWVGENALPGSGPLRSVVVADCTTDLPVRVGEEALGTWHASDGTTLVAVRAGCYGLRTIGYGAAAGASAPTLDLRTQRVQALTTGVPEYLFTSAPSSVWSSTGAEVHSELQRSACP